MRGPFLASSTSETESFQENSRECAPVEFADPEDLPDPGIKPGSLELQVNSLPSHLESPHIHGL